MEKRDDGAPDESLELSASVTPEGIPTGKVRVGNFKHLLSVMFPNRVARSTITQAIALGIGEKVREGRWVELTEEERGFLGLLYADHADKLLRRAQIVERAENALDEISVKLLPAAPTEKKEEEERSVEPDWLRRYWADAELVSQADVQELYGRILAGEHVKPGSFSLRTLHVLRNLDQETAEFFGHFRTHMLGRFVPGPFTVPGRYGGVTETHISVLREAGLVDTADSFLHKSLEFRYGRRRLTAEAHGTDNYPHGSHRIHRLTSAGAQLAKVAHFQPDYEYFDAVVRWLRGITFHVEVEESDSA